MTEEQAKEIPIVVSYGGGTNSTAMLILMKRRGERPALIMFADTGDEKPETYSHLYVMQSWCMVNDFPQITVVKNDQPKALLDGSLSSECIRLGTMPSKTFGFSSCSVKWKVTPQEKYLKQWMQERILESIIHYIGYDYDEIHRSQKPAPAQEWRDRRYPLIDARWGRDECVAAIDAEGLPRPGKSACFMCPSSKKWEVVWLKKTHPELYGKAIAMEARAINGEGQAPAARVAGLGRNWNWQTFAGPENTDDIDCGCYDGESAVEGAE